MGRKENSINEFVRTIIRKKRVKVSDLYVKDFIDIGG